MEIVTIRALLDAIAHAETGSLPEHLRDSDYHEDSNGLWVRGRYQITEAFADDAIEWAIENGALRPNAWNWACANFPFHSRMMVVFYWKRWANLSRTAISLSQIDLAAAKRMTLIFQGGPKGHLRKTKKALEYWRKVKAELEKGAVK